MMVKYLIMSFGNCDFINHIAKGEFLFLGKLISSFCLVKEIYVKYLQWLAKKLVVSVSKIRKLAVVFLFVEIQKLILYMVLKT